MCVCVYIKNQFDKGKNPGKVGDFIGQKMREHGYFVEREKRKSTQILARNNFSNILLHYTFLNRLLSCISLTKFFTDFTANSKMSFTYISLILHLVKFNISIKMFPQVLLGLYLASLGEQLVK